MLVLSSGRLVAAGSGCLGLQQLNRTIVPRIPSSRGPEPPWVNWWSWVQAEQLYAIPTAAWPAGPRQPEQLFVFWTGRQLGSLPTPNNSSLWQPNQVRINLEKRTMAGFCGFGGSPKPDEPGTEPEPEALGKPEPESPRHPRK